MIFGIDQYDHARRNIAPGEPASLTDSLSSAFDEAFETRTSMSAWKATRDAWGGYLDEVRDLVGERFDNPMDALAAGGDLAGPMAHARARAAAETEVSAKIAKLAERFPDLPLVDAAGIRARVANDRRLVRERRSEVASRESGFLSGAAAFVGMSGGVMLDPPVLGSMAFGAPLASGILRAALIDAGVGGASEVAVQGLVQTERAAFGEKPDLGEAAESVAMATGGSGVFSLALRAGARGTRALVDRFRSHPNSEVRDAAAYVERQASLEETSPFRDTPDGRIEHMERLDAALNAVRDGRAVELPSPRSALSEAPRTPGKPPADAMPDEAALMRLGSDLRDSLAPVAELEMRERSALLTAARVADDPETFLGLVNQIRRPPEPEGPRLLSFLQSKGGIVDEAGELRTIGINSRTRPGLIRPEGLSLDYAREAAAEAGYLNMDSTVADFLELIRDDFSGRVIYADGAARAVAEEAAQLVRLGDDLAGIGIDLHKLRPEQARAAVQRMAADLHHEYGDTPAPVEPRIEAERVTRSGDNLDADTNAILADVLRDFNGRMDEAIYFDGDNGTTQRMTVREMLKDFDADERLVDEFKGCIAS